MPPVKKIERYRAREAFGATYDGEPIIVHAGEIVRGGHPILKGRENLFEEVESFGRFDVETAEAKPEVTKG